MTARRATSNWLHSRKIPERLRLPQGTPSEAAADIILDYAERGRR